MRRESFKDALLRAGYEAITVNTTPGERHNPEHSHSSTSRTSTASASPRPGSSRLSAASATLTTTLSQTMVGLLKTEIIRRRGPWRSFEAVELATLEWVDWFNNRRLLEPIGNVPLAERKRATMQLLSNPPWRRDLSQTASGKPGADYHRHN